MIEDVGLTGSRPIFITDIADPRLALYRNIKATNETRRSDEFVLEGEKLFDALRASRFPIRSVLATDRRAHQIAGRVPPGVPFYVVPHGCIGDLVGYDFHLGVLSTGERRPWPELEEVLGRGARILPSPAGRGWPRQRPGEGETPSSEAQRHAPSSAAARHLLPGGEGNSPLPPGEGGRRPGEGLPEKQFSLTPTLSRGEREPDLPSPQPSPQRGEGAKTLVICPRIDNPDNLGTILRIGDVFGIDALIVGGRCPDAFSRRVLRVSMGTALRLPLYAFENLETEWERLRTRWGFQFVAAVTDIDAEPIPHFIRPQYLALVLGAESPGLAPEWIARCDRRVTIPMRPGADSLNVAVAAGILLHRLMDVSPGPNRRL